jgi:F-type H+-transporting ATPase subunit delta
MKISKDARRTARQLFRLCLVNGKLDETRVRAIVQKVAADKPRGYVAILESFVAQVRAEIESQRALVESATALDAMLQANLKTSLSKKYGRELNLEFQVKPELLGGIRVKVGSDVWDGTVKARLEALKAQLA